MDKQLVISPDISPIHGFLRGNNGRFRSISESEINAHTLGAKTRRQVKNFNEQYKVSSSEYIDDDPADIALLGLKSHIHILEQQVTEDEKVYGVESDYQINKQTFNPRLSSTCYNLLDEIESQVEEVSGIAIRVFGRTLSDESDEEDTATQSQDTAVIPDLNEVVRRVNPSPLQLELANLIGLDNQQLLSPLDALINLPLLLPRTEDQRSQLDPPLFRSRVSRPQTPEEHLYQELLIGEGLDEYLPRSPLYSPLDNSNPPDWLVELTQTGFNIPDLTFTQSTPEPESSVSLPPTPEPTMAEALAAAAAAETAEAIREAEETYLRYDELWNDDYNDLNLDAIPIEEIKRLLAAALEAKQALTNSYFALRNVPAAQLTEINSVDFVKELKTKYVTWYRTGLTKVQSLETAAAAGRVLTDNSRPSSAMSVMSVATEEILSQRVLRSKDALITSAERAVDSLTELLEDEPDTNRGMAELDSKLEIATDRAKQVVTKLKELAASATQVGLRQEAARLTASMDDVEEIMQSAKESVRTARVKLGLPSTGRATPTSNHVKAPVFKGEYHDTLDYFTFKSKFEEYTDSVNLVSKAELLIKLRNDCVAGQAKDAISTVKSYEEAMKVLKRLYGKPKILYAHKEREILDYGKCPTGVLQKRSWLINIVNKLTALRDLSNDHGIRSLFNDSTLASSVIGLLTYEDKNAFEKKTIRLMDSDSEEDITREQITDLLMDFLDKTIRKVGKEINYKITTEYGSASEMLKGLTMEEKKGGKPANNGKPTTGGDKGGQRNNAKRGNYQVMEGEDNGDGGSTGGNTAETAAQDDRNSPPSKKSKGKTKPKKSSTSKSTNGQGPGSSHSGAATAVETSVQDTNPYGAQGEPRVIMTNKSMVPKPTKCGLCQGEHTTLLYCETYRKTRVRERWQQIVDTKSCFRCLRLDGGYQPGTRRVWFEQHSPFCKSDHLCEQGECVNLEPHRRNHITLCLRHVKINRDNHEKLLKSIDMSKLTGYNKFFYTQPRIMTVAPRDDVSNEPIEIDELADIEEGDCYTPVYMLQWILAPDGTKLLQFFDTGCQSGALNDRAVAALTTRTITTGPTVLEVAGGATVRIPYGDEGFVLPLSNGGTTSEIVGLRMSEITSTFPTWELMEAWTDVCSKYKADGGDPNDLPAIPDRVGGQTVDIMLGIRYYRYFPRVVYELPSGLKIHKSVLKGVDGKHGVLGGPHPAWRQAVKAAHIMGPRAYFTAEMRAYSEHHRSLKCNLRLNSPCGEDIMEIDDNEFGGDGGDDVFEWHKDDHASDNPVERRCYQAVARELKEAYKIMDVGTAVEYRCTGCRGCNNCRRGEFLEQSSLQAEKEQSIIEKKVWLDLKTNTIYSRLPFIVDPIEKLKPNMRVAQRVLESQIKLINKNPEMRLDVLKSHSKLLDKGHVVPVASLPVEIQQDVLNGPGGHYLCWRTVFKAGSISTPCRLVFDGSARTPGGECLNECLAKGENTLAKLLHILINFRAGAESFSSDISMAYNQIKLMPSDYKYQKYLFPPDLDDAAKAVVMCIITIIYGIKSSGNMTIAGFNTLVEHAKAVGGKMAMGGEILRTRAYMDDVMSAFPTKQERDDTIEGLIDTLKVGGMSVKAVAVSGMKPPESMSSDGQTVGALGYVWDTERDTLRLDIKPTTLAKAKRGKPAIPVEGDMRSALWEKFTKRVILGTVARVYDPMGLCTPIVANLRVDMSEVTRLTEGWDDKLPEEILDCWVSNLDQIQQLSKIEVPRNVLPGPNPKVELIACSDASQTTAIAAVYARVEVQPGKYEVNLLTAKSQLVNKSTIPKAELRSAVLLAGITRVVRYNLGDKVLKVFYVTDSTITLSWLFQDQRPLQTGTRNAVIEIRRLSSLDEWYWIPGELNCADIGTRPVTVDEIAGKSEWLVGKKWMAGPEHQMPIRTLEDIKLSSLEQIEADTEVRGLNTHGIILVSLVGKVSERYKFSKYIIDPCSRSWPNYLRRLTIVLKCVSIWKDKTFSSIKTRPVIELIGDGGILIAKEDLDIAEEYLYLKTTAEVKRFNKPKAYLKESRDKDGILLYTGRILEDQKIDTIPGMCLDLDALNFCKPIVDRFSPVGYSVMEYMHRIVTHHGGAVATYRRSLEVVYVLGGKDLAMEIRNNCLHCKRYKMKLIDVSMGKIHRNRLTPSPAFFHCQVDLFGPFLARCEHQIKHKSPVKVWGCAYKCQSTLAVWVEALPGYDAATFIDGYQRFSSRFGHPAVLMVDEGSQIVAACNSMEISFSDLSKRINGRHRVKVIFKKCVVGQHQGQGQVERTILTIRIIFEAVFKGLKLTIMGYCTAFYFISNEINSVPMCLGNRYKNLDEMDLMTPARLLLGRNNQRAAEGLVVDSLPSELRDYNYDVEKAWWKCWETQWLINMIPGPSGERDPEAVKVGDIVVYMATGTEQNLGPTPWRTGRIAEAELDVDGSIRRVIIEYKIGDETDYRRTSRSVRTVAVLHREGDLDLFSKLNEECKAANIYLLRNFTAEEWRERCEVAVEPKKAVFIACPSCEQPDC